MKSHIGVINNHISNLKVKIAHLHSLPTQTPVAVSVQNTVEENKYTCPASNNPRNMKEEQHAISLSDKMRILTIPQKSRELQTTAADVPSLTTQYPPSPKLNPTLATAALLIRSTTADSLAGNIRNTAAALSRAATANPAGALVSATATALLPTKMGDGSLQTPCGKQFIKTLPAAMLEMPDDASLHRALTEQRTVYIPVRGRLILSNGEIQTELVKTAQPSPVRVVAGVPDGKGHYSCTIPATDYLPARTILVSPANAPGVGGPGAISTPIDAPQAILHTGGQTQPSNLPILTPYPGLDEQGFNDLIVVPPFERDDGPIYVMLNSRHNSDWPPNVKAKVYIKSKPIYTLNKDGIMLGINGPILPSKTLWMGKGKERIDVENPAPGRRAGQIHYQDRNNNKYYYDPITQTFPNAPKIVNDKLDDPTFKNAIEKGMKIYLGEK